MHFIRVPVPEGAVLINVSHIIRIQLKTKPHAMATVVMVDGNSIDVKGQSAEQL